MQLCAYPTTFRLGIDGFFCDSPLFYCWEIALQCLYFRVGFALQGLTESINCCAFTTNSFCHICFGQWGSCHNMYCWTLIIFGPRTLQRRMHFNSECFFYSEVFWKHPNRRSERAAKTNNLAIMNLPQLLQIEEAKRMKFIWIHEEPAISYWHFMHTVVPDFSLVRKIWNSLFSCPWSCLWRAVIGEKRNCMLYKWVSLLSISIPLLYSVASLWLTSPSKKCSCHKPNISL